MQAMNFGWELPVLATGSALPKRCVSNAELVAELAGRGVETSDEWIKDRTGITQRYYCGEGESTLTLATDAARQTLERAGVAAGEVDIIVVATCTADRNFPSIASRVQDALGMPTTAFALDVNAACSGFVYALALVRSLLITTPARKALVVGAEQFSRILDFNDRGTCVLFGDGAGALLLGKNKAMHGQPLRGLLAAQVGSDGSQAGQLESRIPGPGIAMNGREVFKQAVRRMGQVPAVLAEAEVKLEEVDRVVPHQANKRILEAAAESLGLPREKLVVTVDRHANTSAASIPLALEHVREQLVPGNVLLLQAFGAGFTWGEAVLRW